MRFIMIVKASGHSEAGVKPSRELNEAMRAYNDSLTKAGVLLSAERLQPSSSGLRISYPVPGGQPKVTVGPFAWEQQLVSGYTLIEVESEQEAIDWAMRMPDPQGYGAGEIELRRLFEQESLLEPKPPVTEFDLLD
ncbi:YciI family protein [Paenibacillus sp. UNC451MF]|uniref:YciI family protein n=1 Tax=Paenibacillus sp. UNC451MF TaxID=1449063 RepID=UPI000491A90B|nr:YciI family protein [Paenibacillus sp. UNC451MF]